MLTQRRVHRTSLLKQDLFLPITAGDDQRRQVTGDKVLITTGTRNPTTAALAAAKKQTNLTNANLATMMANIKAASLYSKFSAATTYSALEDNHDNLLDP